MKTLEQNIFWNENNSKTNKSINNLTAKVNQQINQLFINEKENTHEKVAELSDKNEVNSMEYQLAELFWKSKSILWLNNDVSQEIHTLSVASVMDEFEEYESDLWLMVA